MDTHVNTPAGQTGSVGLFFAMFLLLHIRATLGYLCTDCLNQAFGRLVSARDARQENNRAVG